MCLLYALKIYKRYGGKLLFSFQPSFHVMVCANGRVFHGTNRGLKSWRVEELDADLLAKWLIKK